jgi:DNA polymerase V
MDPLSAVPVSVGPPVCLVLVSASVPAGFPLPAEDHAEDGLDLTRRFVRNPPASFVVRASGESLSGMGILAGDYLVVDRSRTPRNGDVVIAIVDGAFTAKRFSRVRGQIELVAANPAFKPTPWTEGCEVWGVVTSVHRDLLTSAAS